MNVQTQARPVPATAGSTNQSAVQAWLRALELTAHIADRPQRTFPIVIDELAARFGDAPALIGEHETFSFRTLGERANRYARWATAQGIRPGDAVCLAMANRPEYLAVWLGITAVGGVVALLNINLTGAALAHCIGVSGARRLVVSAELLPAMTAALPHLADQPKVFVHGDSPADHPRIDLALAAFDGAPLSVDERPPVTVADRALCIYTSGTTGLPKAANVSHHRVMMWAHWFAGLMQTTPHDRMYDCLPMYHSVGGVVAIGSLLVAGGSVVIRERFSASRFWDEVRTSRCTLFQYIGELCRYLVNAPPHEGDTQHGLRLCCGNGLRPDVWEAFKSRFAIPRVLEFYAATEGNFSLYNVEGKTGAIGRIPSFIAHRFPAAIVEFDLERGVPVRDEAGFCVRCARDEPGEAIGRIEGGSQLSSRFEGYTSQADTEKKMLRNVFEAGDAWVRTGDLMRLDSKGFFYFVDRIGDTFRWKGENVSTFEVAEAVSGCPGVVEATVYGVTVPGADGRAGMAALVVDADFDMPQLWRHMAERLPEYARPLFLRLSAEIVNTETFKRKKQPLIEAGFDPASVGEPLFMRDDPRGTYVALDAALHGRILAGQLRL